MNIVVTGACGFIGSHLVKHLLARTDNNIIALDKLAYSGSLNNLASVKDSPRLSFCQLDICDLPSVLKALQDYQVDAIFNLAAESHVDRSLDKPAQSIDTNIMGVLSLLEACRTYLAAQAPEKKQAFRFIQVSTDEVFGDLAPDEAPWTESSPYLPSSPYSASKASANHLVHAWQRSYGLPAIISHASNNYGPFQLPEKLIPLMILKITRGETLPVYGDGHQRRDWLYVEDHVEALALLLERGKTGSAYNIGGHCELSNLALVNRICEIMARDHGYENAHEAIRFVDDRPGHDRRYALDSSRMFKELGWQASTDFDEGLSRTIDWYLDNPEWCAQLRVSLDRQGLGGRGASV